MSDMKIRTMAKGLLQTGLSELNRKNRIPFLLSSIVLFVGGIVWALLPPILSPSSPPVSTALYQAAPATLPFLSGAFLITLMTFFSIYSLAENLQNPPEAFEKINRKPSKYIFFSLIAVTLLLTILPAPWIKGTESMINDPEEKAILLSIPALTACILATLLLGKRVATILSVIIGMSLTVLLRSPSWIGFLVMISGIFSTYAASLFKGRIGFIKSGLLTGVFLAIFTLSIHLFWNTGGRFDFIQAIISGLSAGLISTLAAIFILPLMEKGFGALSDMALTELLDVNHPLLREFYLKAPGSYQHSMSLAYLSEAAATSIGENPKLARISAYFHDVGKMERPQYFIENQAAYNRHELLTPRMSALILIDHVRRGMDIGNRYRLPQIVIDAIPEHHGTRLMQFFYRKAFDQESDPHKMGPDSDFRYPGPKPHSKITAIIMLADAVEAAGRVLQRSSPTPSRIQGMIEDVFSDIIRDGQLDESSLTLEEIAVIKSTFTQILVSIYHHRIPYPKSLSPRSGERLPARKEGVLDAR